MFPLNPLSFFYLNPHLFLSYPSIFWLLLSYLSSFFKLLKYFLFPSTLLLGVVTILLGLRFGFFLVPCLLAACLFYLPTSSSTNRLLVCRASTQGVQFGFYQKNNFHSNLIRGDTQRSKASRAP